jgi:hypothetical protein
MPLICPDDNPNRRRLNREAEQRPSVSFEEWMQGTLWYVAAP